MFKTIAINHKILNSILIFLFFLSGSAALIYQILWERILFMAFGVDLISVTIIVSVFMFGLGLGGLIGGYLATKFNTHLLKCYLIIEIGIALFGFMSPNILAGFGNILLTENHYLTVLSSFLLLAWPTILMGATFPILVTHVNKIYANVGIAVGNLYFANTLGGALGAYFAGFILLKIMEINIAIYQAAILNLCVAAIVILLFRSESAC